MNVYLLVTPDKYELPLYIADTAEELAIRIGRPAKAVKHACAPSQQKRRSGKKDGYQIRRVSIAEANK